MRFLVLGGEIADIVYRTEGIIKRELENFKLLGFIQPSNVKLYLDVSDYL